MTGTISRDDGTESSQFINGEVSTGTMSQECKHKIYSRNI